MKSDIYIRICRNGKVGSLLIGQVNIICVSGNDYICSALSRYDFAISPTSRVISISLAFVDTPTAPLVHRGFTIVESGARVSVSESVSA